MPSYTETFGGANISPAKLSYRAISLTASVTLVWPTLAQSGTSVVADKMDVTPSGAGFTITMPDATEVSTGEDAYFFNAGSASFQVLDAAAGVIVTVAAGEAWYIYLRTNATAAGTWRAIQMGTGTSASDAGALAGLGLVALATLLNQSHPITTKAGNYTLVANDRAQLIVSTGGAITFAFTTATTLGANWFTLVRNDGTGTLTLNPNGAETIDGSATLALAVGESCFVVCDGSNFRTVGYGRSSTVTITAATVAGGGGAGTQALSTSEVAAQVQEFSGVLTGARNYEYGGVVGYWFVYNNLTLAGNLATWRVNGADAGVTSANLAAGSRGILISNGTNIFLAMTAASGTVTSVATGTGLSGGPITTTGTLSLANTAATPGTYVDPTITVDAQGRITAAASAGFSVITADPAPAVAGSTYACNTSGGAFTLTLPAAPTAGDRIGVLDARGTFETANLTVGRNGLNIMGVAENMTVAIEGAAFTLVYVDATQGWALRDA
mgnify:CR=1 FL=1